MLYRAYPEDIWIYCADTKPSAECPCSIACCKQAGKIWGVYFPDDLPEHVFVECSRCHSLWHDGDKLPPREEPAMLFMDDGGFT